MGKGPTPPMPRKTPRKQPALINGLLYTHHCPLIIRDHKAGYFLGETALRGCGGVVGWHDVASGIFEPWDVPLAAPKMIATMAVDDVVGDVGAVGAVVGVI